MKPKTLLILSYAGLASCSAPEPRPDSELVTASAAIEEATQTGAAEYAIDELNRAQEKIARARTAIENKDYLVARRLAEQVQVDAQLAQAKAETARTQQAAAELNERLRELRGRILREGNRRE